MYKILGIGLLISVVYGYSFVDEMELHMSPCAKFKYEFANLTSIATSCFIKSSQPLRICQNCREDIRVLQARYRALEDDDIGRREKLNCADNLLRSDVSSPITDLKEALTNEWGNVNCDKCYDNDSISPEFKTFLARVDVVMACLQSFTNASLNYSSPLFETLWQTSDYWNETACGVCQSVYGDLGSFYTGLREQAASPKELWGGLCGDMGDIMNTSRYLWSKKFRCNQLDADLVMIIPVCLVLVLVLSFYCLVSTYFHNRMKTVFYKQRRLRAFFDEDQIRSSQSAMLETMD